jgi:ATP:ADP antiporter, AAA family
VTALIRWWLPNSQARERRRALVAFATLFGIVFAFMLLQTVADTVFLTRLPVAELPWVYLATAVLATAIATLQARRQRSVRSVASLTKLLVGSGIFTALSWLLVGVDGRASIYVLSVWVGLFGTLATFQAWLVIGLTWSVEQAKHVFGFIGTGAVVGALCGAASAAALTSMFAPRHSLLVAAAIMCATGLLAARGLRVPRTHDKDAPSHRHGTHPHGTRHVLTEPYVRWLLGVTVVAGITLTLADFWFKHEVKVHVAPAELGPFLGTTYAVLHAIALLAQAGVTSLVLRKIGAPRTLLIVPAVVLLGSTGSAVGLGLLAALVLKLGDESLRHTLDSTAHEVLHLPIPEQQRGAAKRLLDVLGRRTAQAIGSFVILALGYFAGGHASVPMLLSVLSIAWIAMAMRLRPLYIARFRDALGQGNFEPLQRRGPLELSALEMLLAALSSPRDGTVLAAIDALDAYGKADLLPTVLLRHPSEAVVLRSLALFSSVGRRDFVPMADLVFDESPSSEIRAAALRASTLVAPDPARLHRAARDISARVRATAMVGLVAQGETPPPPVDDPALADSAEVRVAIAEALCSRPTPAFDDWLEALATDPSSEVRSAAAAAIAMRPRERFVPALIEMLADRRARESAREALVAVGDAALPALESLLSDPDRPHILRLHAPRSIARFAPEKAIPILVGRLAHESDGTIHYKIIRGLALLARYAHDVDFGPELDAALAEQIALAHRQKQWVAELRAFSEGEGRRLSSALWLLVEVLEDKYEHTVERVFRLLELHGRDDFVRIWHGTRSRSEVVRSSSRELIRELLEGDLRERVLALVEEHRGDDLGADTGAQVEARKSAVPIEHLCSHSSELVRELAMRCRNEIATHDVESPAAVSMAAGGCA